MNYPVWDLSMGAGVLIAVVATLHVFVSHFAVGGGLWLVVTEARARRAGDAQMRQFVKDHSRFFMLLTLVFGAISGVGIWTTIGLISPQATSALIHAYVWGWAIEWVFFFIEIAAAIVYYYGWERLDARTHEIVGWIYFAAAFLSLIIINGIITFMLTPGGWLENQEFWTGFFNPTYWPSAVLRTFGAVGIAGMFTLLAAAGLARDGFRDRIIRWNAGWALAGVVGVMLGGLWYGRSIGVWEDNGALVGAIPVLPMLVTFFKAGLIACAVLALLPLVLPAAHRRAGAVLLLLVALFTMGAGEWLREAGRKPFTIHGYLYSTGMLVEDEERFAEEGMAANTKWISPAAAGDEVRLGRDLYLAWCQPCHTVDGYNGLAPWLALWNEDTVADLLPRLQYLRALMPPWYGTDEENEALTAYLMTLRPEGEAPWGDPGYGPEKAFAASCGLCHTPNGHLALAESFMDMDAEEIGDFVDESGDFLDEMPGFHGPGKQRELLVQYLMELGEAASAAEEGSGS